MQLSLVIIVVRQRVLLQPREIHNLFTNASLLVYCEACADKVNECAMCRKEKEGIQRVYLG